MSSKVNVLGRCLSFSDGHYRDSQGVLNRCRWSVIEVGKEGGCITGRDWWD